MTPTEKAREIALEVIRCCDESFPVTSEVDLAAKIIAAALESARNEAIEDCERVVDRVYRVSAYGMTAASHARIIEELYALKGSKVEGSGESR